MFTWISRLGLLLILTGCVGTGLPGLPGLGGGDSQVVLTRDAVTIVAPRGFCIDPDQTRDTGLQGFALFGNCAGLSNSRLVRQPRDPAILTAAVSDPGASGGIASSLADLGTFFASPDGLRALSRTGNPETVTVLQSYVAGDVFYLRATDTSPGVAPGVRETYWRAYFDIGPRIATFSVLALQDGTIDEAGQLGILETFVAQTRAANTLPSSAAAAPGGDVGAAPASDAQGGLFNFGLFRRILGQDGS